MKRIFFVLAAAGCAVPADVGQPCVLVRSNPDGGMVGVPIRTTDPEIAFSANLDIISFGGTDCSTRVCVRDAAYKQAPGDGELALGYCSVACGRCTSELQCRALVLDEQTLERLRTSDPERYQRTFGETTTPYFCAR